MVPCSGFQSRRGSRCSSGRTPQALRAHGALSAFVQPPLVPQNSSLTAPPELLWPHLCPQITHSQLPQSPQYCPVVPSVFLWPHLCPKIVLSQLPQSSCGSSVVLWPHLCLQIPLSQLPQSPQCCPGAPSVVLLSPILSCCPQYCPAAPTCAPTFLSHSPSCSPRAPLTPNFTPRFPFPAPTFPISLLELSWLLPAALCTPNSSQLCSHSFHCALRASLELPELQQFPKTAAPSRSSSRMGFWKTPELSISFKTPLRSVSKPSAHILLLQMQISKLCKLEMIHQRKECAVPDLSSPRSSDFTWKCGFLSFV